MSTPSIKELRQARARDSQRTPTWLRWLLVAGGLFALYVIVGFFVAPPIVRSQLEKRLATELGREVRVEKVALNPLTLSGAIEGFAIREADGQGDFVAWRRAFANFDSWSLLSGEWRFDEVTLDGARAQVAVDREGKFNFADVLARFETAEEPVASTEKTRALRIVALTVSDARLDYTEDLPTERFATTVGPVSFALRDFSTGGEDDAPGQFTATTESGESIGWRGTLAVAPLRSSGDVSLGNIVLKKYMPYVSRFAKFEISDGILGFNTHYDITIAGDQPSLKVRDGALSLQAFKFGAPGAEPAVILDKLDVSGIAADSDAMKATVAKVGLAGGRVAVTRDAQGIDLLRLLEPKLDAPAADAAGASMGSGGADTPAIDATLGELAVTGFSVVANDTTTPRPARHELSDISLTLKEVSLADLAKSSPMAFLAKFPNGGSVNVTGALAPQPLKGELAIELSQVPLAPLSPYVEMFADVRLAQGAVSTQARVNVDTPAGASLPSITAHADATVENFQVMEADGTTELARWSTLAIRGVEATTAPSIKLLVAEVEWTDPAGFVTMSEDGTLAVLDLLKKPAAEDADAPAPEPSSDAPAQTAQPFIALDRFVLNNASFTFRDRSTEPDVAVALNKLSGTIAGLSSANLARADVGLKGKVNGVSDVSIRGQINPLASDVFTDLVVDFRGIDLRPTGPYVAKYAGYQLDKGALTLDVKAKLSERRLDVANVVTLDQFTLGQKSNSPDATKLPVTLALALLRDRQGKIVLDVPVQGRLDDPEFRIGRVVMRVIGNILTKAATSPFSLLGSMFGGGGDKGEELAFQEFVPGTTELTPESIQKLDTLVKALAERPALNLDIAGSYDANADVPALREREFEKGLRALLWEEQQRAAPEGQDVPPLEEITVSPQARTRLITMMYLLAFPEEAPVALQTSAAHAPKVEQPGTEERTVQAPIGPRFRRSGAPVIVSRTVRREAKAAPAEPEVQTPAESQTTTQPGPTVDEMRAKLLAALSIDEDVLRELAAGRAQRVRAYLVETGGIDAARVSIAPETANGPRADLQLK